jgi:nucleotidyltransferase substrate binding protein (TIGR01987 family)
MACRGHDLTGEAEMSNIHPCILSQFPQEDRWHIVPGTDKRTFSQFPEKGTVKQIGGRCMNNERTKKRLEEYRKAVSRLGEALDENTSNPLVYDATIQRFEFAYELAWKLMRAYLDYEGIVAVNSPRSAFKEAFAAGLIINGDVWIEMIDDRNLTVHTYNEKMAKEIYDRIRGVYFASFAAFANKMKEVLG